MKLRALEVAAALAALACLVVHRFVPLFPMEWAPWAAGTACVAALCLPVPELARPGLGVLGAGLLFLGGLPAAHNATFPWVELGRARPPEWEDVAGVGLVAAAVMAGVPPARGRRARSLLRLATGLVAAVGLGAALLYPVKANFQVLSPPAPQIATVPVLDGSGTTPMRWARVDFEGPALTLLPAIIKDEWALMDVAAGIHQEASPSLLRVGLWRALEGVAAIAWLLRVVALPAAVLAVRFPRLAGVPLAALLVVPVANLVASVPGLLLADDRALRPATLASALTTLLVFGAVARSGR